MDDTTERNGSPSIDVRVTVYTVIACWLIFALTWLLGSALYVAPLPVLVKALLGMQEYGYAGDLVFIFVYWSLFAVWLPWSMRKGRRDVDALITRGAVVHVVITVATYIPTILVAGSR